MNSHRLMPIKPLTHAILTTALASVLAACGGGGGSSTSSGSPPGSGSGNPPGQSGISWSGTPGGTLSNGQTQYSLALKVQGLADSQAFVIQVNATGGETVSQTATISANGTYTVPGTFYVDTMTSQQNTILVSMPVPTQPADGSKCQPIVQMDNSGNLVISPAAGSTVTIPVLCSKYPAATPAANVQLVPFPGRTATVIASPAIVPVVFSGSTNVADYQTFLQQIVTSQYWSLLKEYGVGTGTAATAITASTTWPSAVTESDIEQTIVSNSAWGAPITSSTVLVLFLPQGTTYEPSAADTTPPCTLPSTDNCSIRGQVTIGTTPVQFIAMQADTQNNGNIQYPALLRHLVDAVTNPGGGAGNIAGGQGYVEASTNPDWYVGLNTYQPQNALEIGNACSTSAPLESDLSLTGDPADQPPQNTNGVSDLPLPYSNRAASSDATFGYCYRTPYGAVADFTSSSAAQEVTATRFGYPVTDEALVLAPGASTTLKLTAWSSSTTMQDGDPFFDLQTNYNRDWYYVTGTNAPVHCENGGPEPICASAPSFTLTPASTVAPVFQGGTDPNGSDPANGPITAVNGDTYTLTVTASNQAEPGMWVMYIGGQPIAVTNATTWQ